MSHRNVPQPPYRFKSLSKGIGIAGKPSTGVAPATAGESASVQEAPRPPARATVAWEAANSLAGVVNRWRSTATVLAILARVKVLMIDGTVVTAFIAMTLISASILVRALYHGEPLLQAVRTLPAFWEQAPALSLLLAGLAVATALYTLIMRLIVGSTIGELWQFRSQPRRLRRGR